MVNPPFVSSAIRYREPPKRLVLQPYFSEVPTYLNSFADEKLRECEWLISAILREISQLSGTGAAEHNSAVILSGAWTSRSEVSAESKDPCTILRSPRTSGMVHLRPRLFALGLAADWIPLARYWWSSACRMRVLITA